MAQNHVYPIHYDQYFRNPGFINPATTLPQNNFELKVNSRILIGPFQGVNSSLAQASFAFNKDSGTSHSSVGIIFQNENEGSFLTRTRLYGTYVYKIRLTQEISINSGAALGIFSYGVHNSSSTGGGGAFTPDGKIGLLITGTKWSSGIGIHQLFNNEMAPFAAPIRLKRFYSLYGHYQKDFSEYIKIHFYYTIDYYGKNSTGNYIYAAGNLIAEINNSFELGGGYRCQQGISIYTGAKNIEIGKKKLRIGLSYFLPTRPLLLINRSAEVSLVLE